MTKAPMNKLSRISIPIRLAMLLLLVACQAQSPATPTLLPTKEAPLPTETLMPTAQPTSTEPVPVESTLIWKVASKSTKAIYEQRERAALVGFSNPFWPDSHIGFVAVGDKYRFFAPNGPRIARMLGTFDDPGEKVESIHQAIQGIDSKYPFASGGPIYRDPETGMLLMFYHAEMYLEGKSSLFHSILGLAASEDEGQSFHNLGVILETAAKPNPQAPCCADMGGATYTIKDDTFYVYFRDRLENLDTVQLALATAPVAEVVEAARNGNVSPWFKYYKYGPEPGLGGQSSPLETDNAFTNWFSVSYNTFIKKYIMAISSHSPTDLYDAGLYLITSDDGLTWSPRIRLDQCSCELTYPTIISPDGNPLNTSEEFYIYFITTPRGVTRWQDTTLQRMTVTLTGEMVEIPRAWEFEHTADREGWSAVNKLEIFGVNDGALIIETSGNDNIIDSPALGFNSATYSRIEVRMKSSVAGMGQFLFSSTDAPVISASDSVPFSVEASDDFKTYVVDMSQATGWSGRIEMLRFDPVDKLGRVEVDYIRLLP